MKKENNSVVWTCENETDFYPTRPVQLRLKNGTYNLKYSAEYGAHLTLLKESKNDKPFDILNDYYKVISKDFQKFWDSKDKCKNSGLEFNRAILLHGHPGSGKKYLAKRISESFDGITIYANEPSDLKKMISYIKMNDCDRKILVILEDVGILLEKNGISSLVELFKSNDNEDGIYIIATTNYEEKIADYISDRPGIFEEKFLIDYPNMRDRKEYISQVINKIDENISDRKINKIAKDTEGLSIGYIKNLIESVYIYEYSYQEKLEEIKEMKENIVSSLYSSSDIPGIGFGD